MRSIRSQAAAQGLLLKNCLLLFGGPSEGCWVLCGMCFLTWLCFHRYLEEVGYTDTILDMRSKRVRSLLGRSVELNGATEPIEGAPRASPGPGGLSGGESLLVKQIEEQIKR